MEVIVLSYKRDPRETVRSLQGQKGLQGVWVWHNHPSNMRVEGAVNIFSDINLGCSIRQSLALHIGAEYTVFVDDDLVLKSPDICARIEADLRQGAGVSGLEGKKLATYSETPYTHGSSRTKRTNNIHMIKGLLCGVRTEDLVSMFRYRPRMDASVEDDIWMNAAISIATGKRPVIVGFEEGEVEKLSQDNGLCLRSDHLEKRDGMCREMFRQGWLR